MTKYTAIFCAMLAVPLFLGCDVDEPTYDDDDVDIRRSEEPERTAPESPMREGEESGHPHEGMMDEGMHEHHEGMHEGMEGTREQETHVWIFYPDLDIYVSEDRERAVVKKEGEWKEVSVEEIEQDLQAEFKIEVEVEGEEPQDKVEEHKKKAKEKKESEGDRGNR